MNLRIKLSDGFSNDTVVIRVNGHEVYRKTGISTDLRISHAGTAEIATDESTVKLEVTVVGGASATKEVKPRETPFVNVRVIDGRMELQASAEEQPML